MPLARLVLASASPRRQALIGLLGLPARVAPAHVNEEAYLLRRAVASALNVAVAKADAIRAEQGEIVVAADTLVVVDGDILGKPADAELAKEMLLRLRGRAHSVLSGVALRGAERQWTAVVETRVVMRAYSDADVDAYVARGEPFDKAGGYAVQDDEFRPVNRLEGCYLNVVGLPVCAVAAGVRALGADVEAGGPPPCDYCARGSSLVAIRSAS